MTSLRMLLVALAPALALSPGSSAQQLRRGHAHTQEAAAKEIAELTAATPDLASWEKRKATVKAGILAGARLD
ncbi:MAG: hypothetical protein CMO40_01360, partial [Verrucomicrobiaceae bacterium]|nr:hypothetical protein [Verrucomicrobiaceae bacterium]